MKFTHAEAERVYIAALQIFLMMGSRGNPTPADLQRYIGIAWSTAAEFVRYGREWEGCNLRG